MAKKEKELMFLGDQPRALKKIAPATQVKKRPVVNINKVDQDADLFNKVGKSPAKLKTKNPDPFGDDLINMDDFGEFKPVEKKIKKPSTGIIGDTSRPLAPKPAPRRPSPHPDIVKPKPAKVEPKTSPRPSPSAGSNEELGIDARQPKASKKAPKKAPKKDSKKPDDGYKFYGKEGTGLGDFSRKHRMQYATQKQFEKDFNMDDGEKAGGRPGRGKLKTQGMNKAGKRKAGFSGRGSGASLRGF